MGLTRACAWSQAGSIRMIARELTTAEKTSPSALLNRLRESTVVWSWVFNGFRLASGLILLPLILAKLSTPDLGMYYVLLSLWAIVPLVDFGFGPTIGRFVSYAMGGADEIQAQGVARPGKSLDPNYPLLWELLFTTRSLYRYLTLVLFVVLGAWGTYTIELRVQETTSPLVTRLAWLVTLVAACFEIYAGWWGVFLRSMNEVMAATRIAVLGIVIRLVAAAGLLVCGVGLLSLPIGSFLGIIIQRHLSSRRCRELLQRHSTPEAVDVSKYLRILWPNTWRLGMQFLSGYLTVNANTALCLHVYGLNANAQYGLSVQLVAIITGMAAVWTSVKWPLIGQCQARQDLLGMQRILQPRVWLQTFTFLGGCGALLVIGPWLLHWLGGSKEMLPLGWLALLMLNAFLEMQFVLWGTLLSLENRLVYLWPTVATNILSLVFSFIFVHFSSLGLGGLVLGPLFAGLLFNYWYWPPYAARRLGTTLLHLLLKGPSQSAKRLG
ncbi:MAG TPA: hypothetical protein VEC99_12130 [Clostridia bacterium]|nr:hypothetical protein [Clostridia bacterium]